MDRTDQKLEPLKNDIKELARAINTQAQLLSAVVNAADHILKTYVNLTTPKEKTSETPEKK